MMELDRTSQCAARTWRAAHVAVGTIQKTKLTRLTHKTDASIANKCIELETAKSDNEMEESEQHSDWK